MSVPGSTTRSGKSKVLSDDTASALKEAIEDFRKNFTVSSGELLIEEEPAEPIDESKIEQDTVKKYVKKPAESK